MEKNRFWKLSFVAFAFLATALSIAAQPALRLDMDLDAGNQMLQSASDNLAGASNLYIEVHAAQVDTVRQFALHITFDSRYFQFEDFLLDSPFSGEVNLLTRDSGNFLGGSPFVTWKEAGPFGRTYIIEASLDNDVDFASGDGLIGVLNLFKTPDLRTGITTDVEIDLGLFTRPDLSLLVTAPGNPVSFTVVNGPPQPTTILSPANGSTVSVSGLPTDELVASWNPAVDLDNDELTYIWQLLDEDAETVLVSIPTGTSTQVSLNVGDLRNLLELNGLEPGNSRLLFHRVIVSDGEFDVAGPAASVLLEYGIVDDPPTPAPTILLPAPGSTVTIEGMASDPFTISWTESPDPNGAAVAYTWQVFLADQTTIVGEIPNGQETQILTTMSDILTLLLAAGATPGSTFTVAHRVVVTDGTYTVTGPFATVAVSLGVVNDPPTAATDLLPADGSTILIEGDPAAVALTVNWTAGTDPDSDALAYTWEAATDAAFTNVVLSEANLSVTTLSFTVGELNDFLRDVMKIPGGGSLPLYHRVSVTDGTFPLLAGPANKVFFTRRAVTGVENTALPQAFSLAGNYPNPFNPTTSVVFDLPETAVVSVEVFDTTGRNVLSVPGVQIAAGFRRNIHLGAGELGSGLYVYRVIAELSGGSAVATGKMTLVR